MLITQPNKGWLFGLLAAVTAVLAAVPLEPARAATFDCASNTGLSNNVDISGNVSASSACLISTLANDPESGTGVNDEGFFGVGDWQFVSKTDITTSTGTWSLAASLWDTYGQIMLLFKGPNANAGFEPDGVVGYLLVADVTSGTWTSPYSDGTVGQTTGPNKFKLGDVSHISIYGAGDPTIDIDHAPVPGALPLFGTGVAILGWIGLRRRRAKAT